MAPLNTQRGFFFPAMPPTGSATKKISLCISPLASVDSRGQAFSLCVSHACPDSFFVRIFEMGSNHKYKKRPGGCSPPGLFVQVLAAVFQRIIADPIQTSVGSPSMHQPVARAAHFDRRSSPKEREFREAEKHQPAGRSFRMRNSWP